MMRAADGLREISSVLRGYGVEESPREAELILRNCMGVERVAIYRDNPVLSDTQWEGVKRVLKRRKEREPLQYILGYVDFYGLRIKVGPGVLIPRPETELIVEEVSKTVKRGVNNAGLSLRCTPHALRILDLCTGSGCLALALAKQFGNADVWAVDCSEKTLDYAAENAKANNIKNVIFLKGDLYEPVQEKTFDIIVSNPPYIRKAALGGLAPEIRDWEPPEALDGGEDGLEFYRKILSCSADHLADDGFMVVELGQGEAGEVAKIAEETGLRPVSVVRDFAGIERVLRLVPR
jgi:release factor glutamine methyltransferase